MNLKRISVLALSAALIATPAMADGFSVYEWSARGVGMAGAMMFSDEASLLAYNPAAMTLFDEKGKFSSSCTYIDPRGKADFFMYDGSILTQTNKKDPAIAPTAFYARKVQPNLWFGVGVYPRFGLQSSYNDGWYGRYSNRSVKFMGLSFAPTVAWKVTPTLSMSFGAELMYTRFIMDKSVTDRKRIAGAVAKLDAAAAAGGPGAEAAAGGAAKLRKVDGMLGSMGADEISLDLDGTSWGAGCNFGINWQASPKLSLAFLARSEVKQHVSGDVNFFAGPGEFPRDGLGVATYGDGNILLPESYQFGVGYRFDDRTRAEFDAIRTSWSTYDTLAIDFLLPGHYAALSPDGVLHSNSAKNWRDGWRYQFGVEHRINDKWTVRAGYVYDECSSNNPEYADFMVPTGTRETYCLGASYQHKNIEYSLGYGYMKVGDKRINHSGALGEDGAVRDCDAQIVSLGISVDF